MKDIRIFVASSKELERERNYLAFLVLEMSDEFVSRGFRVRLAKWEYVDPRMGGGRTEDRYLAEMYDCDAALILFRNVAGLFTCEEMEKALFAEREGTTRLKTHRILFCSEAKPRSDAEKLRDTMPPENYGQFSGLNDLREEFLALVDRVAKTDGLRETPPDKNVRVITAFLAADDELSEERNAFADTVLNLNDLLEQTHRNIRVQLRFYDPEAAADVIESSEMGLALYGTNCRVFGRDEIESICARMKDERRNPKRFYVFFRNLDDETEKLLDGTFRTFRNDFVSKYEHFICQFGDANAIRWDFIRSLERYVGESMEIYSTVPAPTAPVFVGRENDLGRLRELLDSVPGSYPVGRLPVITGAGGTGKSELVRQYASQFRVQYPGGVFQVDMEHVETWDDVFLGILKGVSNNGVKVVDYLDLRVKGNGGAESEPLASGKVRDALLRKARLAGPMLLVLDNVEECMPLLGRDGGFLKAFPAGFSERVRVNVVATARVCDAVLSPTDWAVLFPLGDLSPESALELLLKNKNAEGEKELAAAKRIAELLGYRALYLRRVPSILNGGHKNSSLVCRSYVSLAEALEKDSLPTIHRTATVEDEYLPVHLWKLAWNSLSERGLGEACIKLVKIASFFSPVGFPKHLLRHLWDTLVFPGLENWGSRDEVFEEVLDLARDYNLFQSAEPVRMHRLDRAAILQTAREEPGLEEAIGKSLASYEWMSQADWLLLADNCRIVAHVPPQMLTGELCGLILLINAEYADLCPWQLLEGNDWAWLLGRRPRYADRCSWKKLNGADWVRLLGGEGDEAPPQPQFADRCPWAELVGWNWSALLQKQPRFADRCPWDKLNGRDWGDLLGRRPQFADRCPWEMLDVGDWVHLLCRQPQFADRCPWEKLSGFAWACLLGDQPRFADRCPWEELKESGDGWVRLLACQPQFADRCPWEKLDGHAWARLLGGDHSGHSAQPQLAERCPWGKLDGSDWAYVLGRQPQFADRCPWEKLDGSNWADLLGSQPRFADRCPWKKLEGFAWARLLGGDEVGLSAQPQFADGCPWEKLDGSDWAHLLGRQPQFANRCPWEKLDGYDWVALLGGDDEDWFFAQLQFADKCAWEKLDADSLLDLLEKQPHLASIYPLEKLVETDDFCEAWDSLSQFRPQLGDRFPWETLDGSDWAEFLCHQPQFADKCFWEKLDGGDWAALLVEKPQFADRCPWKKLGKRDWQCLLATQPQLAVHRPAKRKGSKRGKGKSDDSLSGCLPFS